MYEDEGVEVCWVVPCGNSREAEQVKQFLLYAMDLPAGGCDSALPAIPRPYRLSSAEELIYRWAPGLLAVAQEYLGLR